LRGIAQAGLGVGEAAGKLHHLRLFGEDRYGEARDPFALHARFGRHLLDGPPGAQAGLHLTRGQAALGTTRPLVGAGDAPVHPTVEAAGVAPARLGDRIEDLVVQGHDVPPGLGSLPRRKDQSVAVCRQPDEVELSQAGS